MDNGDCRVLVLGAHPDDAEIFAGGLIVRHCRRGATVKIVSVTDGRCGHHQITPEKLVEIRRDEARAAGERVGAEYVTWDFHDGSLQPTLEVRSAIIREIRAFNPDLVLTHRTNDYHPDHRAVGLAVQDASYLVTVPHCCPETPALPKDPVVAAMSDLFTRPNRLRADVLLEVSKEFDTVVQMAAAHQSQFFEWLPYHDGQISEVPTGQEERHDWLRAWMLKLLAKRAEHFRSEIVDRRWTLHEHLCVEAYEISEYAGQLSSDRLSELFPAN